MELICLIKCPTELAFGVQREFTQKGEGWDMFCAEGEGLTDWTVEESNKAEKGEREKRWNGVNVAVARSFTQDSLLSLII